MTENFSERIENALNDIQKIQIIFKQKYGEECLADKEIEKVLKIAKAEHEEVQQYRAIGTVEECRKAREGQIAKKPRLYGDFEDGKLLCPNCEEDLMGLEESGFDCCPYCGQKLDWSEYGW
jgi:hypothetical protein